MQHQSPQEWFFQMLVKEAFIIYAVTWGLMFLLETIKSGVISNYLSLPHALLPLFFLGVLWLAITPEHEQQIERETKPFPFIHMVALSLGVIVILMLIIEAGFLLTTLIIFATLAALWAGAFSYYKQQFQ